MDRINYKSSHFRYIVGSSRPKLSKFYYYILIVVQICNLCQPTQSFDLLSTLMSQGSSSLPNLKSLVSPELLEKMKGLMPYPSSSSGGGGGGSGGSNSPGQSGSNGDVSQIEKLLAKLKPAEGRFDPAVLELLANMDHRQHLLAQSQSPSPAQNQNQNQFRFHRNKNYKPTTPSSTVNHQQQHLTSASSEPGPASSSSTEDDPRHFDSEQQQQDSGSFTEPINPEHSSPVPTTPPALSTTKAFQVEGKPKFSSKFRLPIHKNRKHSYIKNKDGEHPIENTSNNYDYVLDPNIRNHRLYELELEQGQHDRFETYENFTALDQMEDLMAEESYDHPEVAVPPPHSTSPRPRLRSPSPKQSRPTTMKISHANAHSNNGNNNGWVGKRRTRKPDVLPKPKPIPVPMPSASASYEELISFETETDEDMSAHDRQPLQRASTEKTVIYSYPVNSGNPNKLLGLGSGEPNYDSEKSYELSTTNKFRPSPMDLSPPVYFEPDQDFYTSTLNNKQHRAKSSTQYHRRRKQQQQQQQQNQQTQLYQSGHGVDPDYLHTDGHEHEHHDQEHYKHNLDHTTPIHVNSYASSHDHAEYAMSPNFNQQPQPHEFLYPQNQNQNQNNQQFHQPTTLPYPHNMNANLNTQAPFLPLQSTNNNNNPTQHLNQKQDRILQGASMMGSHMQQTPILGQSYSHTGFPQASGSGSYIDSFRNSYAGSENVYHEVPMSPYVYQQQSHNSYPQQSAGSDLTHSAGQNYYQNQGWGWGGQGQGHLQPPESSWTSTFFILGGLVALSAAIAFFLPSFLAAGTVGKTGGKDTGDDKVSNNESDLWTEIKGLYTDIVSIAKGDYATLQRHGPIPHNHINVNDLPKITHVSDDEADAETEGDLDDQDHEASGKETGTIGPDSDTLAKRFGLGEEDVLSGSDSYSSEEDFFSSTTTEQLEAAQTATDSQSFASPTAATSSDYKIDKKKKKKKPVNINDTLAFGVYNNAPIGTTSRDGLDFANVFNQTLHAWEKVPLLSN